MKISARNTLTGKIQTIKRGAVNAEVTIELAPGLTITSIITLSSAERLGLEEGMEASAIVKASDVMIATEVP